jgi:hypothetical protein
MFGTVLLSMHRRKTADAPSDAGTLKFFNVNPAPGNRIYTLLSQAMALDFRADFAPAFESQDLRPIAG